MTKDEYVKTLEKIAADNAVDAKHDDYYDGYFGGLKKAIDLAEKLDEPKKVVIPEFIANDIKYHKRHGSTLRGALGSAFDQDAESNVYYWFFAADGDENVRKYISAWDNGYEVEKEPKYKVRIKGFDGFDCTKYVNYHMPDNIFLLNDRIQTKNPKLVLLSSG
ncbi:DUF1642 domain-containing protein [Pediococcus pentosaceus]|uniref:DUF1642 domain-containing protein n=1 Tax=Pediococcus pentosaceus TaxID=1255 RepID=UPI0013236665|nr:DUF1642 domain-containing protein [Pediococcus pentosaceus]KAF0441876.1 DUF1642 domain-containing protein [Pediococcus pentosaceus]MBF7107982.1 DUF1642 domain-containing protein [Pediococcus pentosaceus]